MRNSPKTPNPCETNLRKPTLKELADQVINRHAAQGGGELAAESPTQEAARQDVLAQLKANPRIKRAFTNRFEHGYLIVTLAIRGVGTGELSIPADRFDPAKPADYAALLDCMDTRSQPGEFDEGKAAADLATRIGAMAARWGYSAKELAQVLEGAEFDPQGWLAWVERDEEHFGGCVTPGDFAARYPLLRGVA